MQQSDVTQTENLGIGLGLDVNTLYELAAEHVLMKGDFTQAARLYQFAKVNISRYTWW